ncbi:MULTISPECIES: nucleotide exchange factor GrpE [Zymobacter]|uniref:Protein GrpE n=1 Tax=Zymobacter palmae TaxID=33074 RepID=A0A348HBN6_9GAMM|nr:nucleotide exchange factor GrpE [Zymobacter palmae]BBG29038.1 molecular chaperone GrpE [Zymobacter palmae]
MSRDSNTENEQERNEVPAEDTVEQAQPADAADTEQADSPEARIAALEEEVSKAKDQALRAAADAQNARRRAEQDAEKARKFALERFVKELLPVVDSLEKALESLQNDEGASVHREGLEMTLKMQHSALEKFGVKQLEPQGEPFDPQYHEAMTMVPNPAMEPNTVMDVLQKGYTLNDRLVRPAMVVVSKGVDA